MANPVGFEGSNDILMAPDGSENCSDLEILRTDNQVISCWRLTEEELARVNKTGVVWFSCYGPTHPPVFISGEDFVKFEGKPAKAEPYIPRAPKRKE